ncbi:hypothetical protein I5M32_12510 [Pedobacter sp. SD-b]|uniref:Uncharacterized protein n=1 Tax=Pedobacter segetis TaxID=2793069 RepID=A0ABS1BLV1_9SPHI|nr:hypothetical protein [Pedobacter segetis]MBK0383783.1 hypothetical protein [Pedobacter segetis]
MEDILNQLVQDEILHTTNQGTDYLFITRSNDGGVTYSINQNRKTLPYDTIMNAFNDFNNQIIINRNWYNNYNKRESKTRPCNLAILKTLLNRIQ